jgi:cytokinin riboside 5'-monophosphate phosphoribohydrolase
MREREIVYEEADERIVTETMRERKEIMESRADAFVALPGGFGTLEELLEIVTLRQLACHRKPVAILNTDGFYAPLIGQFARFFDLKFTREKHRASYQVAETPAGVMEILQRGEGRGAREEGSEIRSAKSEGSSNAEI